MAFKITVLCITAALAIEAAPEFRFTNKCSYTINLYGTGTTHICDINTGATIGNNCGSALSAHGLFRHTSSNEANCKLLFQLCLLKRLFLFSNSYVFLVIEYSLVNAPGMNQVWYDVSNIPPMVCLNIICILT